MKINIEYHLQREQKELSGAIITPHICYAYAVSEDKRIAAATGKTFPEARAALLGYMRHFAALAKAAASQPTASGAPADVRVEQPSQIPQTETNVEIEG